MPIPCPSPTAIRKSGSVRPGPSASGDLRSRGASRRGEGRPAPGCDRLRRRQTSGAVPYRATPAQTRPGYLSLPASGGATQAAIRAGYSEKTARSQGQRLLTNVDIWKAISGRQATRAKRLEITADAGRFSRGGPIMRHPSLLVRGLGGSMWGARFWLDSRLMPSRRRSRREHLPARSRGGCCKPAP